MPTSAINKYTTPESTAKPVVAEDLKKIVDQMMLGDVMYFASSTERSTAFATLGISPPQGALSYLADVDRYERYSGGWGALPLNETVDAADIGFSITVTTSGTNELDIGRLANVNVQLISGQSYRNDVYLITNRTVAADEYLVRIRQGTPVSGALLAEQVIWGETNTLGQEAIAPMLWSWTSATVTTNLYVSVVRNSGTTSTMSVFGQIGARSRSLNILTRLGPASRYRTISS